VNDRGGQSVPIGISKESRKTALVNPDEGVGGTKVDACDHWKNVMENMELRNSRRGGVKIEHAKNWGTLLGSHDQFRPGIPAFLFSRFKKIRGNPK
jgi:hypothetical protein